MDYSQAFSSDLSLPLEGAMKLKFATFFISSVLQGVGYAYSDNRMVTFPFPYVTTLFSASNYCGTHGNKAAVMVFYEDSIQVGLLSLHTCIYVALALYATH